MTRDDQLAALNKSILRDLPDILGRLAGGCPARVGKTDPRRL